MKERIIWDNLDVRYEDWEEDFKDWCEANSLDEDEMDLYEWVDECLSNELGDERMNLNKEVDGVIVCFADLGLWDGHHIGYIEKVYDTLSDAIKEALNSSRNYQDYKVVYENGRIYVHGLHHDGTNIMEIRLLSRKGEKVLIDRDEPDWDKAVNNEKNFKILQWYDLW